MQVVEGQELPTILRTVTEGQIKRYAQASGDTNPIHLDPDSAAQGPFGQVVAHGMLILAFVSEMLTQAFGQDWLQSGNLKARFRAPVYPDDRVATYGRVSRTARNENGLTTVYCTVGCRKADGQDVITGETSVTLTHT